MAASGKKEGLLKTAVNVYDQKKKAAEEQYKQSVAKIEEVYQKQVDSANSKYDEFIGKVDEDTDKRLKIVNKVIDAESEERRWKADQEQARLESEARAAAEKKMQEEAEAARAAEEAKQQRIAEKKAAKARKKMLDQRAKFPIPPGFVNCANSKKLAAKLKKLAGAGRYAFCCFYLPKDAKGGDSFKSYCEELSAEYNDNVAWFDCAIKDMNFEDAMLLYEFNNTPCVVVCREGRASNLHRYVIGTSADAKETLKRYAEKANAD